MRYLLINLPWWAVVACLSCSSEGPSGRAIPLGAQGTTVDGNPSASDEPTLRASVSPVKRADEARPGVFIPPYVDCRARPSSDAKAGGDAAPAKAEVCTPVSVSGCTELGKYYPDYASCDVVRTQRPYWPAEPAQVPRADDPRLEDAAFMSELRWVTEQVRASACTCCHDSTQTPKGPSQWAIDVGPIWTDTVSNPGIALFTGLANSSVLGAYDPHDNNGFDRSISGLPSTDPARMRAFFVSELERRGITETEAAAVPPFGGLLYANQRKKPEACESGEGVGPDGRVRWDPKTKARYVYVLEPGANNPGVPPNFDLPEGTIWRLDVAANSDALETGIFYGATPPGSFQSYPQKGRAPALRSGLTYHLFVLKDVGRVTTNCLFTYEGR